MFTSRRRHRDVHPFALLVISALLFLQATGLPITAQEQTNSTIYLPLITDSTAATEPPPVVEIQSCSNLITPNGSAFRMIESTQLAYTMIAGTNENPLVLARTALVGNASTPIADDVDPNQRTPAERVQLATADDLLFNLPDETAVGSISTAGNFDGDLDDELAVGVVDTAVVVVELGAGVGAIFSLEKKGTNRCERAVNGQVRS